MEGLGKILIPFDSNRKLEDLERKLIEAQPLIFDVYFATSEKKITYRYLHYTTNPTRIPNWFINRISGSIERFCGVIIERMRYIPPERVDYVQSIYITGSQESIEVARYVTKLILGYVNGNVRVRVTEYAKKSKLERQKIRRGKLSQFERKFTMNGHQVRGIYKTALITEVIRLFRELLKERKEKSIEADFLIRKKLLYLKSSIKRKR